MSRAVDELVAGRHLLGGGGLHRVHGGIDQLEFELAGLADQRLEALHVLDARDLHEHAVAALALNAGLGGAEGVDAAPDGFDRGLDRRGHAVRQPLIGNRQRDAGVGLGDIEVVAGEAREYVAPDRRGKRPKRGIGLVQVGGLADRHRHGTVIEILPEVRIADAVLAQRLAHVAANIAEPVLDHLLLVELIEEMRAALQVEAEIDLLVRQPSGQPRHGRGGKYVGKREQEPGDDDAEDQDHLPSLKMQHCRSRSSGSDRLVCVDYA